LKALHNNEMKQTKPALARMARSSLLISVLGKRLGMVQACEENT
jgi:hypothetical protein